jgi:hypothetical protein
MGPPTPVKELQYFIKMSEDVKTTVPSSTVTDLVLIFASWCLC